MYLIKRQESIAGRPGYNLKTRLEIIKRFSVPVVTFIQNHLIIFFSFNLCAPK